MPRAWSDKDERKYEHIKDSSRDRGMSKDRAEEIAARTVNKSRREEGRTPNKRSQGTGNPNRGYDARTRTRFSLIEKHLLLARSADLGAADARLAARLGPEVFTEVMKEIPDDLLRDPHGRDPFASAEEARARYVEYLTIRLESPRDFVAEAVRAREARLREPPRRLEARR